MGEGAGESICGVLLAIVPYGTQIETMFDARHASAPSPPAALRNKTYPLHMILSALTDYGLGCTIGASGSALASLKTSPS